MVSALSVSAFASDGRENGIEKTVTSNGYTFEITEQVDASNRIIQSYENNENSSMSRSANTNIDQTKALLVALGMQEDNVNKLTTETLKEFAEGERIYVASAYSKTDENNNVTPLTAETAIQEATALKEQQDTIKMNMAQGISLFADYSDYFEDSYMRVDFAVTYKGNGSYLYSVDGEWLTMPFFRGFDSLGACAMNGTVTNTTRSGRYDYDITYINNGKITYDSDGATITDKKNAVNGNWYGSAGVFNLPNDVFTEYSSIIYDNFTAHYQYQGHVTSPSEPRWFNTIGTYDHATVSIAFDPSVSIDLNGDVSASIGLSLIGSTDSRTVEFEVYYRP
ncbi:MAG: hypothetical protein ACK5JH_09850 [Anaerocolumna sp.]